MKDPILFSQIQREVMRGNVTVNPHGDLLLFKYSQTCAFEKRWNKTNMMCRGLIMKEDGTVVARPFPKFFNVGEMVDTEPKNLPWSYGFDIWEKIDGSCGIGFQVDGIWQLATPGSITSEQAKAGTEMLDAYDLTALPEGCTPIFEIVYPGNRVVVDYGDDTFLSLLAIYELNGVEWHPNRVDQIAERVGCRRPQRFHFDLDHSMDIQFNDNSEGYVIRFTSGTRVKIKSPTYVRIHRLLEYRSPKRVIQLIRGREYGTTIAELPKAIQAEFDDIRGLVQTEFHKRQSDANIHYEALAAFSDTLGGDDPRLRRKAQAEFVMRQTPPEYRPVMFQMLDGKDTSETLWKMVELSLGKDDE